MGKIPKVILKRSNILEAKETKLEEESIPVSTEAGRAIAEYTKKIERFSAELALTYYQRGSEKYQTNDMDGAISDYTESIRLSPTLMNVYHNRGFCLIRKGEYKQAISDFTFVIDREPDALSYRNRALAYAVLKEDDKSKTDYEKAVLYEAVHLQRSEQSSRTKMGVSEYARIASEYAKHAQFENDRDNPNHALIYCMEAIRLRPEETSYYLLRARIYFRLGKRELAASDKEKVYLINHPKLVQMFERFHLEAKSEVKNSQNFSSSMSSMVGQFLSLGDLNSYAQTNRENFFASKDLLEAKMIERWKDIQNKFNLRGITPQQLLNLLIANSAQRIGVFKKAIELQDFSFISYLVKNGVDINVSHIKTYSTTQTYSALSGGHDGMEVQRIRTTHYEKKFHALDDILKKNPLPTETLFILCKLGATFTLEDLKNTILPRSLAILNAPQDHSLHRVQAAGQLLMGTIRILQPSDILPHLSAIMKVAKYIADPDMKKVEAYFLMVQLESVLPSNYNFLADKQDSQLIKHTIAQLKEIIVSNKMTAAVRTAKLEGIKKNLYAQSKPKPGESPRKLFQLIQKLLAENLITLASADEVKSLPITIRLPIESSAAAPIAASSLSSKPPPLASFVRLFSEFPFTASPRSEDKQSVPLDSKGQTLIQEIKSQLAELNRKNPTLSQKFGTQLEILETQYRADRNVKPLLDFQEEIMKHFSHNNFSVTF